MQNYNRNMDQDYPDLYSQYSKIHTNSVDLDSNNGVLRYQTNDMKPIGIQPELQSNSTEGNYEQQIKTDCEIQPTNSTDISQELSLCYDNDVSTVLTQNNTELSSNILQIKEDESAKDLSEVDSVSADTISTKIETELPLDIPAQTLIEPKEENTEEQTDHAKKQDSEVQPADNKPCARKRSEVVSETAPNEVCRICMKTGILISIFDNSDTMRMCEKVMSCAAVQVAERDGLPGNICEVCASDLETAYAFKKRCESSDVALREKLGVKNKTIVKTEFVLIDCENEPVLSDDNKRKRKADSAWEYSDPESDDPSYGAKKKKLRKRRKNKKRTVKVVKNVKPKPVKSDSDDDVILVTKKPDPPRKGRPCTVGGKYPCTYCEKSFPYPSVLKLHMVTHTKEKTHKCSICSMAFMYSKELYSHYKDAHPNEYGKVDEEGKFNCSFCDKSFGQLKNLKVHEAVHSRDKKYKCEFCPQGFTNMTSLNLHKKQDHPGANKPYRCKICDKRFKQQVTMEKHVENHKQRAVETKVEERKPTSTRDLFKTIAPVTTTYWSDSFSD